MGPGVEHEKQLSPDPMITTTLFFVVLTYVPFYIRPQLPQVSKLTQQLHSTARTFSLLLLSSRALFLVSPPEIPEHRNPARLPRAKHRFPPYPASRPRPLFFGVRGVHSTTLSHRHKFVQSVQAPRSSGVSRCTPPLSPPGRPPTRLCRGKMKGLTPHRR